MVDEEKKADISGVPMDEDGDWESIMEMFTEAIKIATICGIFIALKSVVNIIIEMYYIAYNELSNYILLLCIPAVIFFLIIILFIKFMGKV